MSSALHIFENLPAFVACIMRRSRRGRQWWRSRCGRRYRMTQSGRLRHRWSDIRRQSRKGCRSRRSSEKEWPKRCGRRWQTHGACWHAHGGIRRRRRSCWLLNNVVPAGLGRWFLAAFLHFLFESIERHACSYIWKTACEWINELSVYIWEYDTSFGDEKDRKNLFSTFFCKISPKIVLSDCFIKGRIFTGLDIFCQLSQKFPEDPLIRQSTCLHIRRCALEKRK